MGSPFSSAARERSSPRHSLQCGQEPSGRRDGRFSATLRAEGGTHHPDADGINRPEAAEGDGYSPKCLEEEFRADLAINCPAYTCRQLGRNVEAGKRQAASNATRRRSIEDPAWTPDGAESLSALVTPARFRLLGRLFDPSQK